MPLLEELVRVLDRPSDSVAEIKVFELTNADAATAVELLTELFGDPNTTTNDENGQLGYDLVGTQGSPSNLIPVRFSLDARTNSVVVIGGKEVLTIIEAILYRLDSTTARNRTTRVIRLRNSSAEDIAIAVNAFLDSQRELATIEEGRISTSQLLEQEVIITPELISNNLIVSATPQYFAELEQLILQLDAQPSQVVIQALLVEVELDNTDEFGVELGFQDSILFQRSIVDALQTITQTTSTPAGNIENTTIVSREISPGFNFNDGQLLGNNFSDTSNPGRVGGQSLSNFALGRTNQDLGYGGLVLSASSDAVNVLIRALAARRQLRVLSRPHVLALDNQIASIQVGQEVPVSDGVTIINQTVAPNIIRDQAGIILTVTPRISPEGQIVMEVVAEKSAYLNEGVPIFTDVTTGTVIESPIKNLTTASTTIRVPDGQTVVVGGMITKSDENIERKVPYLGDLPILGHAFRFDTMNHLRTELLIFLTPRIIRNDADSEMVKQVESGRLHYFVEDAEEVHDRSLAFRVKLAQRTIRCRSKPLRTTGKVRTWHRSKRTKTSVWRHRHEYQLPTTPVCGGCDRICHDITGGCQSLSLTALSALKEKAPIATREQPVMEIVTLWEAAEGVGLDEKPARGFAGQMLFFTAGTKEPLVINNGVEIYVFDDLGTEEEQTKPIHKFTFDGTSMKAFRTDTTLGTAYQLFVPYTRKGPYKATCGLRVKYISEDGRKVYSKMANVLLAGTEPPARQEQASSRLEASMIQQVAHTEPTIPTKPGIEIQTHSNREDLLQLKRKLSQLSQSLPAEQTSVRVEKDSGLDLSTPISIDGNSETSHPLFDD